MLDKTAVFSCVALGLHALPSCAPGGERAAPRVAAPTESSRPVGPAPAGPRFPWPHGELGAVSLTYDDAIPTDIDVAAPALKKRGLRGTFFLTGTSEDMARRPDQWKQLGKDGHELASHTMFHPCDRSFTWVKKGYALQDYDLARMDKELQDSIAVLKTLGAGEGPYTFAFPCNSTWIGEARISYTDLVDKYFFASRGGGNRIIDPFKDPLSNLPAMGGDNGAELVRMVEAAVAQGGWLVLVFHGVGGDYLTIDAAEHERLLAFLEENRAKVWTDTFGAVARAVSAQRSAAAAAK